MINTGGSRQYTALNDIVPKLLWKVVLYHMTGHRFGDDKPRTFVVLYNFLIVFPSKNGSGISYPDLTSEEIRVNSVPDI